MLRIKVLVFSKCYYNTFVQANVFFFKVVDSRDDTNNESLKS